MKTTISIPLSLQSVSLLISITAAQDNQKPPATQDKARVFITDSQSWEVRGAGGGTSAGFAGETHGGAAASQSPAAPAPATTPTTAKLSVTSTPDGADIEMDGSFVGNTPSDIDVPAGEHTVSVKKTGFQPWEKKLKVSSGSNVHLKAALEKGAN